MVNGMEDGKYVVLAADDEIESLEALELFLKRENIVLYKACDGEEALKLFTSRKPDLILLDIIMEGMDGFTVLRRIREESKVPAIMITARNHDYDKILGLELGADDYITKPYNPLEVVARVKAQIRRNYCYKDNAVQEAAEIHAFDLTLNDAECTVRKAGKEILLTRTEYKILELLMKNQGRIFTKQQIFAYAWGEKYYGEDSTIMMHISNLRNKIEDDSKKPVMIKTVKGLGYKFEKNQ